MSVSESTTRLRNAEVLTLAEAAEYLRVDEPTLARLAAERRVPSQKIGEEWRFLRKALVDWLRSPNCSQRDGLLSWMLTSPLLEEWMSVLEECLLAKLKVAASPLYKRGSKQAVLSHFAVFKEDNDLEEQLANLRALREAT